MYQYKAVLRSTKEVIAEGHNITDIEHSIVHFKRAQKKGEHTHGNDLIDVYHIQRDKVHGKHEAKEVLVKTI